MKQTRKLQANKNTIRVPSDSVKSVVQKILPDYYITETFNIRD